MDAPAVTNPRPLSIHMWIDIWIDIWILISIRKENLPCRHLPTTP